VESVCAVCGKPQGRVEIPWGKASCGKNLTYPLLCDCQRVKVEAEQREKAERERQMNLRMHYEKFREKLPADYREATLENFRERKNLTDAQRKNLDFAKRTAQKYCETWKARRKDGRGIIFLGSKGGGKTHLACAIGHEVAKKGYNVKIIRVTTLLREILDAKIGCMQETFDIYARCALLILDDSGAEKPSEWGGAQFDELIDTRTANRKPLILTTNASNISALGKGFYERSIDRIENTCHTITLNVPSYRAEPDWRQK
jgi:DNA replication protein DnaC